MKVTNVIFLVKQGRNSRTPSFHLWLFSAICTSLHRWNASFREMKQNHLSSAIKGVLNTRENVPSDVCAQRRLKSACTSAQSDQRLCWPSRSNFTSLAFQTTPRRFWSGPSCSKLTRSLVNDSLKFTSSDTQICWTFLLKKNVSSFCSTVQ